jgi:hypothetical protein
MLLAEDDIAVGTIECSSPGDAALQGSAHSRGKLRMPSANLLEDRHRADARCGLEHRHDVAVPHSGERVGTPTVLGAFSSAMATADRLRSDRAVGVENPAFAAAMSEGGRSPTIAQPRPHNPIRNYQRRRSALALTMLALTMEWNFAGPRR